MVMKVFLYGKEVDDFHSLNWDVINGVHIGATKELIHRLKDTENEIATLKNEIAILKNENNILKSVYDLSNRIMQLEN